MSINDTIENQKYQNISRNKQDIKNTKQFLVLLMAMLCTKLQW